jgi:hypothetical protein
MRIGASLGETRLRTGRTLSSQKVRLSCLRVGKGSENLASAFEGAAAVHGEDVVDEDGVAALPGEVEG